MNKRYPIGELTLPDHATAAANRTEYLKNIGELPALVAKLAAELQSRNLLDVPYRAGGWTARQVIHHLADSHLHAYLRHKRTLTETHPTLTPYDEASWAELTDVTAVPVAASLEILRGLHLRWATLLATCSDAEWERTAFHAGSGITYRLDTLAATYSWHGLHHVGHLRLVLQ
jgi:hypothetical protein